MDTEEDIICDSDFLDGINETPTSDAPATVSEVAKFWEEFKLITRTYQETDEVDLIMKVSSKTQIMDYMFHYLCACCAFSASSSTMSTVNCMITSVSLLVLWSKTCPSRKSISMVYLLLFQVRHGQMDSPSICP